MSTGEEIPAELHLENLRSWRPPHGSSPVATSSSWSVDSPETAIEAGDKAYLVNENESQVYIAPNDETEQKRPKRRRICLLACLVLILAAIGLGVALAVRDNGPNSPPNSAALELEQCGSSDPMCCNGLESNCRLRVNEVVFAATHNSMSSSQDGFLGPNHRFQLEVR